jgi:hypothetical protein
MRRAMIGSPVIAAWVAHVAFWGLLIWGVIIRELGVRSSTMILGFWLVAFAGFLRIPYVPFASVVAILDIALVFNIFKGDVRLI